MQAVGRLGFPVARVRWLEPTGTVIGQPFFVMDFIEGGVAAGREDRSLAPELAVDFVRRLDELHRLDWTGVLDGPPPSEATHVQIERWADVYRSTSRRAVPLLEEGAAWLHARAPALERVALVHGDPGPGNFVHDGQRVLALTDWEFSHLGDPTEDWSFLLSMRGVAHDAARGVAGPHPPGGRGRGRRRRPALLAGVQPLQGLVRQPVVPRGVRRRQPGAQHGAHRHRRCSRRSCASWPTSSPADHGSDAPASR